MYRTAVVVSLALAGLAPAKEWKLVATWKGHAQAVNAASFSPDGKTLWVAAGTTVKGWDLTAGKERAAALRHRLAVGALSPGADGKSLTTVTADGTLFVWDLATARTRSTVRLKLGDRPRSAAFSPDGKLLAVGLEGRSGAPGASQKVQLWEVPSGKSRGVLTAAGMTVQQVAFAPDGKALAVVSDVMKMEPGKACDFSQTLQVFDPGTRKPRLTVDRVTSPCFSGDGKALATLTGETKGSQYTPLVRLLDGRSGKALRDCRGHTQPPSAVAAGGKRLASVEPKKPIKLWDAETGKEVASLAGAGHVVGLLFSPDGDALAAVSADKAVRVWKRGK